MFRIFRLSSLAILTLAVVSCVFRVVAAVEPPAGLTEIRSRMEEQLLVLDPIAIEFELVYEPTAENSNPQGFPEGPQKWVWKKSGKREFVSMEPQAVPTPGGEREEMWMQVRVALDRGVVTRANFSAEDGRKLIGGARSNHLSEFDRNITPAHFLGLRLFETEGVTLISLLAAKQARLLGTEKIRDEECIHISVPDVPMREGTGH